METFRRETGRTVTPIQAVTEYIAAIRKLGDRPLSEAVATVRRVDLSAAVEEFLASRDAKTKAEDGKRPQLSPDYAYMCGHALCDLTKEHLDLFMGHKKRAVLAPKSRNHYRATIKMFFNWAVRKDYLPANHRLLEADGIRRESTNGGETDFYRPSELRKLLDAADDAIRPIIALCALAGLRQQEALRLTWRDVFGVAGHVEVTGAKAKTRGRRLVVMVPALAEWLRPLRRHQGPVWTLGVDAYQETFAKLRESLEIPGRRNGLRHSFCTYHFAMYADENLTAQQAGNSPAVIHQSYKGLATKKEARAWFAVKPGNARCGRRSKRDASRLSRYQAAGACCSIGLLSKSHWSGFKWEGSSNERERRIPLAASGQTAQRDNLRRDQTERAGR